MLFTKKARLDSVKTHDVVRFDYLQPVDGEKARVGRVMEVRDTNEYPVNCHSGYRAGDSKFQRSRVLVTLATPEGPKAFYAEGRTMRVRKYTLLGRFVRNLFGCELEAFGYPSY